VSVSANRDLTVATTLTSFNLSLSAKLFNMMKESVAPSSDGYCYTHVHLFTHVITVMHYKTLQKIENGSVPIRRNANPNPKP